MREVEKSKKIWHPDGVEWSALTGKGIDIGPADSPVTADARPFDLEHGDANVITRYVTELYDFVYSSHSLEHMHDPREAIMEWWKLVKPGGYLFFTVPDEDLYEQGVFPSRFNPDHKATFTISKTHSWSPVSISVYELAQSLPAGTVRSIELQDHGYDRTVLTFGARTHANAVMRSLIRAYDGGKRRGWFSSKSIEQFFLRYRAIDQTGYADVLAQIQCIVRKEP